MRGPRPIMPWNSRRVARSLFHRQDAAPAIDLLAHAREQLIEPAEVERLAQVVHRAELDGLDRGVDRRVAGHQDGLTMRIDIADRAQDVEAADLRHPQVDHDEVGTARLDERDGRAAVGAHQRRRSRHVRQIGTRRRECPAHRRRSTATVAESVMRPPPCRRSRPPARPGAPAIGTAARARRSPARDRTARSHLQSAVDTTTIGTRTRVRRPARRRHFSGLTARIRRSTNAARSRPRGSAPAPRRRDRWRSTV